MRRTQLFSAALLALAWLAGGTALAQLDAEKVYTIVNNNNANMFMQDNGTGGVDLGAENDNSYWKFVATANTDCYYIQNTVTGKYIQGYTSSEQEVATGDTGVEYCVKADASGTYVGKYRMSCTANSPHDFSAGTLGLNWKTNGDVHTVQSFASVAEGNPRSAWTVTEVATPTPDPGSDPDPDPAHVHDYSNNGICTCDGDEKYQPAEMVDGVYMLGNVGNVEWMSAKVGAGAANEGATPYAICSYKLTADIDYAGLPVNAHKPIGTFDKKFLGVFDGDGHSIKNMKLDQPVRPRPGEDGIGFFGCVRVGNEAIANVVIKNLTIDSSCEIKGSSSHVAGIVGRIHERTQNNTLLIENCINKANIKTTADNVAGIVGQITTINDRNVTITIKDCTNEGAITTSAAYAAGIVAQLNSAAASTVNVIGCTNKGAVQTAGICAAGIVSQANKCAVALNIESCMNFADITSTGNKNCGGIHGANTSSNATIRMINCGNMGNVTATTESAALTGWIGSNAGNVITNCWNTGSVTGISNSDNTYRGTVTATNVYDKNGGQGTVITDDMLTSGELCYRLNGDQSVIAWTQTLDGTQEYPLPVVDGNQVFAHGKMNCDGTSAPGTTYDNNGPDGIIQTPHDISDEIGMCTFCHTQFQEPALVDGYYQIKNAGNLEWFSNKVDVGGDANLQINAKLMNDIDMLSIENLHKPIGQTTGKKYNGTFDGQGFRIKNMIIERPSDSNIGFFGFLRGNEQNTTVKNLIIDASCTIHGYNRVGGITGSCQNSSEFTITIENVVNEATIIAEHQDAAGIIGGQQDGGPKWYIHNVLNTGTVTAKNAEPYAGALCCHLGGNGESVIENFVNLGTINGHRGGNIGRIAGTRTNIIDLSDTDFESSLETNYGLDTGMTSADIAGGRLAYTVGWWQELDVDAYPMPFEKAGAVVYRNGEERCDGADNENTVYSNTEGTIVTGSHDYNATTGFCDLCGMPNPDFKTLADGFYVLDNVIDMKWFAAMVQFINPAINGKLTADLDFESGNCRIGTDTKAYRGTFQGGDHVISNFVVNNDEIFQGLFGYVTGGADISGLVFDKTCSIKCNARGAMIGGAKDGGTVKLTRLGNEGDVTTTNENAAGIIGTDMKGACELQIDQCYSTGTIVGGKESAQIAGWTGSNSLISNSWSCAEVTGVQSGREFSRYGGDNHNGQYVNCFTTYHETNGGLTYDTPAEDFASGKVAYTICKEAGSTIFGQAIGTDATPTFFGPEVCYVGDAGYATMYDTTTGYELNGDVEAYVATPNLEYPNLILTEIENVPQSTPVVLKGTYYNKLAQDVPAINIANALKGTDSATKADGTMYVLAKPEGKEVGFYLAKAGTTIAAGKAYYQPTSNQGVKAFYFSADDATGIENLNNQNTLNTPIYNLAGQRVSKMQKGINIVNGKKILK